MNLARRNGGETIMCREAALKALRMNKQEDIVGTTQPSSLPHLTALEPLPEDSFRAALENSIDGHMMLASIRDDVGRVIDFTWRYVNPAAARIVGRPRDWFQDRRMLREMPGNRDAGLFAAYLGVVEGGNPWEGEIDYERDGVKVFIRLQATKIGDGFAVSFTDLTARRLAEERARTEAERLQMALDAGAVLGTWNWDVQADLVHADERFAAAFGFEADRCRKGLPLQDMFETVHADDLHDLKAAIAEATEHAERYVHQYRVRRLNGQHYWVEAHGRVIRSPEGVPVRFPGILIDIHERRTAELERDRALSLLKTFAEAVPGVVYAKDLDGRMLLANTGTTELIGKPPEDYIGKTDAEFLEDKQQAQVVMNNDRRIMECGEAEQIEEEVRLPDGNPAIWLSSKSPMRDENGKVIGLIGTSIDITERRQMETALRESEAKFHDIANCVDQMIWSTRPDGWHDYFNARWHEFTGMPSGETDGNGWLELFHPDDHERTIERWKHSLMTGEPYEIEYRLRHKSGEYRWVIGRAQAIRDGQNRILRWFGTCTDIHDLRTATENLDQHARVLGILNKTGAAIASDIDLDRIVQTVTDAGVELSGAEFGAFFYNVLDEMGESYTLYTISGVDRAHFDNFPMPRNTNVFHPTFKGEGIIRSDDITSDQRYGKNLPYKGMPDGHLPVRSYLAVPVISQSGEVLGGLFFGHYKRGVFTIQSEELIDGIAGQAAMALDNARLYRAAQQEIVARRNNEEALATAEEFSRSVIESSADCIAVLEPDGKLLFVNKNGTTVFDVGSSNSTGYSWIDHWPEEARIGVSRAVDKALAAGKGQCEAHGPIDGVQKWWSVMATTAVNREGVPDRVVLSCRDITEHKKMEEARQLLLRELNHRVKNLFAIASGMVTMTARSSTSVQQMAETLKGRLLALAKAHELIRSAITNEIEDSSHASLRELLEQVLRPHLHPDQETMNLSGPDIKIGVTAATSFSLIFHELATNAAKYGALRDPCGRLTIEWTTFGGDLLLSWEEDAETPIQQVQHKGFGSKLAATSATSQLSGQLTYDWQPNGVKIRLSAPLSRVEL